MAESCLCVSGICLYPSAQPVFSRTVHVHVHACVATCIIYISIHGVNIMMQLASEHSTMHLYMYICVCSLVPRPFWPGHHCWRIRVVPIKTWEFVHVCTLSAYTLVISRNIPYTIMSASASYYSCASVDGIWSAVVF